MSWSKQLSKVDFPTFVLPIIATGIPVLRACPTLNECASFTTLLSISSASVINSVLSANSNSSWSEKSSSNSNNEFILSSCWRNTESSDEKCPLSCDKANLYEALLVDAIRSATASVCDKSIFPFK